jgi:hypothetical protein
MKQTAVEWLREKLWKEFNFIFSDNILDQAKAMEKEQITLSHINGQSEFDTEKFRQYNKELAEAYYNQSFKSE